MFDVNLGLRKTPNTEHRTPNTEHRTPNIEHRTPNAERRTLNAERRIRLNASPAVKSRAVLECGDNSPLLRDLDLDTWLWK
jgi:hypothetical protein